MSQTAESQTYVQCNQAREQNFFISEFEPILTHKIKSIIDKSLKFGTNLLQHKLYINKIMECNHDCFHFYGFIR